jgi:hypothetical protein
MAGVTTIKAAEDSKKRRNQALSSPQSMLKNHPGYQEK